MATGSGPSTTVEQVVARFVAWAEARPDVVGAALVGSHARGAARPGSDVDLMVVTVAPHEYVSDRAWVDEMGPVESTRIEKWGAVTSVRVRYAGGPEVEVGLASPAWAATDPVDAGTARVVAGGFRILLDRQGLLQRLVRATGA